MGLFLVVALAQMYRPGAGGTGGFAFINESNLAVNKKIVAQSSARRLIGAGEHWQDRNQWRSEVLRTVTNLALVIDRSATRYEVEYEVGDHLHRVLGEIDKKDKSIKEKFRRIEQEARTLREHIDELVARTSDDLARYMNETRKEIVRELRARVNSAIESEREDVEHVKDTARSTFDAMNASSSRTVAMYFCLFQVLVGVSLYIAVQYAKAVF